MMILFQGEAIPVLGSFLRKNQRALKLSTLILLDTLVRNYGSALNAEMLNKASSQLPFSFNFHTSYGSVCHVDFSYLQVIVELPPLLSEADLHIAQLTLSLLTSIAKLQPQALARLSDAILPEILTLAKSPLLQGK